MSWTDIDRWEKNMKISLAESLKQHCLSVALNAETDVTTETLIETYKPPTNVADLWDNYTKPHKEVCMDYAAVKAGGKRIWVF